MPQPPLLSATAPSPAPRSVAAQASGHSSPAGLHRGAPRVASHPTEALYHSPSESVALQLRLALLVRRDELAQAIQSFPYVPDIRPVFNVVPVDPREPAEHRGVGVVNGPVRDELEDDQVLRR